jgi:hypothetical protein
MNRRAFLAASAGVTTITAPSAAVEPGDGEANPGASAEESRRSEARDLDRSRYADPEAATPAWVAGELGDDDRTRLATIDAEGEHLAGEGQYVFLSVETADGDGAILTLEREGAEDLQSALASAAYEAKAADPDTDAGGRHGGA